MPEKEKPIEIPYELIEKVGVPKIRRGVYGLKDQDPAEIALRILYDALERGKRQLLDYLEEKKRIHSSTRLTLEGKAEELGEVSKSASRRLDESTGDAVERAKGQLKRLEEELGSLQPETDDGLEKLLRQNSEMEVRRVLLEGGEGDWNSILLDAVSKRDSVTYFAIRNCPAALLGNRLSPEIVEQARKDWDRSANPVAFDKIVEVEHAITTLEGFIADAKYLIEAAIPINEPGFIILNGGNPDGNTAA